MTLRQKLILLTTLSKGLMALLLLLLLPALVERLALAHTDAALRAQVRQVQARLTRTGIDELLPQAVAQDRRAHYDLLQDEYIELLPSPPSSPSGGADLLATLPRHRQDTLVDFRVLRHPLHYRGRAYTLEIGQSIASVEDMHALLQRLAGWLLGLLLISTLLLELGVIGVLLRPVDAIVARLRAVRGPTAPALPPLPTTTTDFRYLDASLRGMLAKIRRLFEQERTFIADASHELLTPIALLKNRFENMLQAEDLPPSAETQVEASLRTLHRMTTLLRALLLISRIDNAQFVRDEPVALAALLREVADELEDPIAEAGITVEWALTDSGGAPFTVAPANRALLFTLFFNLFNNAIKYNQPQGGSIRLTGHSTPEGAYRLRIQNTGQRIPPDQLPHLFERFHRFDPTGQATGYGLGLAVVRSVARFHQIGLSAESTDAATTIHLRLPAPRA